MKTLRLSSAPMRRAGIISAATFALLPLTGAAFAQSFLPGDLVVSRIVNPTTAFDPAVAGTIFLDEYTKNGTIVNKMFSLPTPNANGTTGISGSFNSKSEGALALSLDGRYLTIMGYSAPVGTLSISNTESSQYVRLIARIDAGRNTDTTTRPTNDYSGDNPRAVLSIDGTQFYSVGNAGSGADINTLGIRYTTLGATTSQILGTTSGGSLAANPPTKADNVRAVTIANNNLYVVKGSGSKGGYGVFQVGPGGVPGFTIPLPAPGTALKDSTLPGLSFPAQPGSPTKNSPLNQYDPFGLFFANSTTLYLADEGYESIDNSDPNNPKGIVTGTAAAKGANLGGLQKYSLVNGTWKLDYILNNGLNLPTPGYLEGSGFTTGLRNIAGQVNADGTVSLFGITSTSNEGDPDSLVSITDNLAATSLPLTETFATLQTSSATDLFRGVAFAPTPEPGTVALLMSSLPLIGFAVRRKRARK